MLHCGRSLGSRSRKTKLQTKPEAEARDGHGDVDGDELGPGPPCRAALIVANKYAIDFGLLVLRVVSRLCLLPAAQSSVGLDRGGPLAYQLQREFLTCGQP